MIKKLVIGFLLATVTFSFSACSLLDNVTAPKTQTESNSEQTANTNEPQSSEEASTAAQPETTQAAGGKNTMVTLYFPTEDNSALKKEEREIQVVNGAILKAMIQALLSGPETTGLHNAIPAGTTLNGVNIKEKVAIVDFSKEFATANDIAGVVERLSVVNTLTSITGVEKVRIHIDGGELIGPSGLALGDMSPAKFDDNGAPISDEVRTITLYFGDSNAEYVIAEKRQIEFSKGEQLERIIFLELMKGPKTEGLHATIPKGTKLLSVRTGKGLCTLDLSKEFVDNSPGGTAGEAMTLNSIVDSLTELGSIKKVQFLIEGQKREVYTHAVFDEPFSRNESIIGK